MSGAAALEHRVVHRGEDVTHPDPAPIAPATSAKVRAPLTLWRYLLSDVWRLLGLTATSLVTLIAFAASIKPLADGQIGLADALKLTLLLVVPMLQFALPFAAGFAATMGYHRFAADNEATAAMAGGIGHRSLLMPAMMTGVVLALVLALLANEVIPSFLRRAERVLTRDATRVFVTPIERGESVKIADMDIHASSVLRVKPDASTGAVDHLVLSNVLAAQSQEDGDGGWMSARQVDLWVFETPGDDEGGTAVQLVFTDAVGDMPGLSGAQERFWTQRILIPGAFRDDPKFLTLSELLEVRRKPERMSSVQQRMSVLASRLAEVATLRDIREALNRNGRFVLQSDNTRLTVMAGGIERHDGKWTLLERRDGAPVTVTINRSGDFERAQHAERAWIELDVLDRLPVGQPGKAALASGTLRLVMERVTTIGEAAGGEAEGERGRQAHSGLRLPTDHLSERVSRSPREMLAEARDLIATYNASATGSQGKPLELTDSTAEGVSQSARNLRNRIADLRREVDSKIHERAAYAVACLIMVLTGAVVAMRLKDSLPLPVYLWSFFPALVAVITISAGQSLTHSTGPAGLPLLWGGVLGLAVHTWGEFRRLAKH